MMPEIPVTRRGILRGSLAAFTAASYRQALGANERIRVANIGCGRRNLLKELLDLKDSAQLEVAAVCDTWRVARERAAAQVKEFAGNQPRQVIRYGEVLADKDIDVVIIGTPDHQHSKMLLDAVRAGKDVYVEKPLAMNMAELILAYDAVKQSGRVVQMGTQMRSYPRTGGARDLILAGGLGQVLKADQVRNGYQPYWMSYGGGDFFTQAPEEQDVDWSAFLMDRNARPYNASLYRDWYGHREFSQGPHTNLMVHFIDWVHFVTGAGIPAKCVALGGIYRFKNEFDAPDSVEVAYEYPGGFLVRYATMFGNAAGNYAKVFGTRGTMDAKNLSPRQVWTVSGEGSAEPDKLTAEAEVPEVAVPHHMQNFFDCVRSRQQPIAPIEAGFAHSVACIMADQAMLTGRRMTYDPARREIVPG